MVLKDNNHDRGKMGNRETYTKIVTCPRCGGEGYTEKWNDREREYDREICVTCEGSRVLRKVVTVEYMRVENETSQRGD